MRKLDKTKTFVTIGDMTYVREVTKLTYSCMCSYFQFDSICVFSEFVELVCLLSKQVNAFEA